MPVRELNYDPHMRKMVAPTAFFFGSVFFAILAVYFMRPESEHVPVFMAVLAAICFVTALSLWTKTRKEKAGRPQVITRSLKFNAQGGIEIHVDVQFPPPSDDGNITNALVARFQTDINSAIIKYFEAHPNDPSLLTTTIENAIEPAIAYIQNSASLDTVKYDCVYIHRTPPPPPAQRDTSNIYV